MNIFNLEQLKQKKQPKEKPKFIIQIKPKKQPSVDEEESRVFKQAEKDEDIDDVTENATTNDKRQNEEKRMKVIIVDKRQNANINRELVLQRIRDKMDIFAVKKMDKRVVETTPQSKIPIFIHPIPKNSVLDSEEPLPKLLITENEQEPEVPLRDVMEEIAQEGYEETKERPEDDQPTEDNEDDDDMEEKQDNLEKAKIELEKTKQNVKRIKERMDVLKQNKKDEKDKVLKAKNAEEIKKLNEELKNAKEENDAANKRFKEANENVKQITKKPRKTKKAEEEKKNDEEQEKDDKKKRKTRKQYEPVFLNENDVLDKNIKINNKPLINRLPKKEKVIVRTSTFYLNNRKKYIQKINELLKPYQNEFKESLTKEVTCDRGKNTDITLFLHQRIVREYLNVVTPYRGLLLYHGLGSGKTCTSIGIAEGMKSQKQIILMTPASLKMNYFSQLKKCGDPMFKKNQFWEFISTDGKPEYIPIFSQVLQIPKEVIESKHGAWLVDVTKKQSNYEKLSTAQQKDLDNQLNMMIRSKYIDINYNGITKQKLAEITEDFTINPFDNKTVIIDEAHNFVSRIVNKIKSHKSTSYILYDYLMRATNVKIVLLTGTPIINYPNEISVLFNILRGYIKTWTFKLGISPDAPPGFKLNAEEIVKMFHRSKINVYDYVEFSNNKLIITRNPFGFVHVEKSKNKNKQDGKAGGGVQMRRRSITLKKHLINNGYQKKKNKTKKHRNRPEEEESVYDVKNGMVDLHTLHTDESENMEEVDPRIHYQRGYDIHEGGGSPYIEDTYDGIQLDETGNISDDDFIKNVKSVLKKNNIIMIETESKIDYHKALPDNKDTFINMFIDDIHVKMKNENTFKKRILGLTSYFRSADEKLMPSYILSGEPSKRESIYNIVLAEMSSYQFSYYQKIRDKEAEQEKIATKKKKVANPNSNMNDMFDIASSYRMFSRAACNFAFPNPPGRPLPDKGDTEIGDSSEENDLTKSIETQFHNEIEEENSLGINSDDEGDENEGEGIKKKRRHNEKDEYQKRIDGALEKMKYDPTKPEEDQYLIRANLPNYSPKFHKILLNVENEEHRGNHLIYSQFRTIEGIGILKLVLESNGFAEFKLKRNSQENIWEISNYANILGKPRFVLYTGTETTEEKEIIRNIYNSDWEFVPENITAQLREISRNNHYGDIIKVFMITASGSEGIDLKNTRYVHIVEPYWNMVRIEQVIGRARRICSHQDLPEELRTVQVFLYFSVFSEEQKTNKKNIEIMLRDTSRLTKKPITTDQNIYDIAIMKTKINDEILKVVKETSMDCSVYNSTNSSEENLVCYNFGRVHTNAFSSHPSIDEDIQLGETDYMNVRKERIQLKLIPAKDPKYAMDPNTYTLYSLESYQQAKEGTGVLEVIGKVEKENHGKVERYKVVLF
jgi:hypothetical protein